MVLHSSGEGNTSPPGGLLKKSIPYRLFMDIIYSSSAFAFKRELY
jgi:hypothetical protein